jgi:hypothetical protein
VVLVIPMRGEKFRNAVPARVLLRNNFRNGVPARSATKTLRRRVSRPHLERINKWYLFCRAAVKVPVVMCWVVTKCNFVGGCQSFGGPCCRHF